MTYVACLKFLDHIFTQNSTNIGSLFSDTGHCRIVWTSLKLAWLSLCWVTCFLCLNIWRNGNPLQCSCLENPRDGGTWWAAVYGVAQSWTRLKRLSSNSSSSGSVSRSVASDCDPLDCSPPGSSVHGIFQTRILKWVVIPFSRRSSRPRDWTWVFCAAGRFFIIWATREAL